MNINKTVTTDNADVPNPVSPHLWSVPHKQPARVTWDVVLTRGALGFAAVAFVYFVLPWYVFALCLFLASLYALKFILTDWVAGIPVRTYRNNVDSAMIVTALGSAAIEDARRALPAGLTTYNPSAPVASKALPAATVEAESVTVLPAMLPPAEWLAWFDTRPHGILAAETGGGKSTTAKAIIASRIERGESVFLLDPHSSDWFGLPGIGGGEDWRAVWIGMQVVIAEYRRRLNERDAYLKQHGVELPHNHFPRLTVLLDEANTACRKLDVTKRGAESPWEQFAEALGSGARKVAISILMLAQSPNVEDIGLSGPMRQNFTRLALDAATTRLMVQKEETDAQRKPLLLEALRGAQYPATSVQRGNVVLLDRTGLDQVRVPHNPAAALWLEGYAQVDAHTRPRVTVSPSNRPSSTVSASIKPPLQTDGRTDGSQEKTLTYLRAFVRAGKTRDDARAWFDKKGLDFSNSLYTEARRIEKEHGQ